MIAAAAAEQRQTISVKVVRCFVRSVRLTKCVAIVVKCAPTVWMRFVRVVVWEAAVCWSAKAVKGVAKTVK